MLEFLTKLNIDRDTIEELKNKYYDTIIYSLDANEYEIIKIIKYFQEIGLTCIEELLLNETTIFLNTYREIQEKFKKYNVQELKNILNNNYQAIEQIL